MPVVTVEEVVQGKALARFTDLPRALHGDDPRFAPPVVAWERYRTDRHRNPYLGEADWAFLLARRGGQPAGRVAVHLAEGSTGGRFGLWSCDDDPAVAAALLAEAVGWLRERAATSLEGPWSFQAGDDHGVLVEGFEAPGTTGRPWSPRSEHDRLVDALGSIGEVAVVDEVRLWRMPAGDDELAPSLPEGGDAPGQAGRFGDLRLVLEGAAAVPDLSGALRTTGVRGSWALARRARERDWEGCTAVRWDVPADIAGPALVTAAARAGYRWAVVPWSPDPGAPPETVHRRYRAPLL